ncbi:hypothetical protein [Fervidobacterium sp.]
MKIVTALLDFRQPAPKTLILATGNGVIKADGTLVMGAGSARALARAYPWTPRRFGAMAAQHPGNGVWHRYGLLVTPIGNHAVGLFQSKGDWRDDASLPLIGYSAKKLASWLREHPGWEAHLAFPGIGLGGLQKEEVLEVLKPILGDLGDRLVLYLS